MQENMKKMLAALFIFASTVANAQVTSNEELRKMVSADRLEREAASVDWSVTDSNDKARASRVMEMLAAGKIETAEDFYNAGVIFQHGDSPDDFKLAFSFATIAARLAPEHRAPKWLAAAAWDRYMMGKKLPQWYGTQSQFFKETGKTSLYPLLADAVSDAERSEASIPPLATIIADIEAKNKAMRQE